MVAVAPERSFQVFDVVLVVGIAVLVSYGVGMVWSSLRVGSVVWLFVREAQFAVAVVAFVVWTVQNRSGGPIEEVDDEATFPLPAPSRRVTAYRTLTGDSEVSIEDAPSADTHVFALGLALVSLSIGVELLHSISIG